MTRILEAADVHTTSACATLSEPLSQVLTLLGKRWTGLVLGTLMQGPIYFSELRRGIVGISDRVLNERLVELAASGLVTRTVVDTPSRRVRYALSDHGRAMQPALNELTRWAEEHLHPLSPSAGDVTLAAPPPGPDVSTG